MGAYAFTAVNHTFDNTTKTLTLVSADGKGFNPFTMRDIYYGDSAKDINLCDQIGASSYYHTVDFTTPTLNGPNATFILQSKSDALLDLNLTMTLLESGVVNVHWTFDNVSKASKTPFEVPSEFIDAKKDNQMNGTLSDFVTVVQANNTSVEIQIKNKAGVLVYQLNGLILSEYYNMMSATYYTFNSNSSGGVMGLTE